MAQIMILIALLAGLAIGDAARGDIDTTRKSETPTEQSVAGGGEGGFPGF